MSFWCKIIGHKNEPANFWSVGDYILYKCSRCGHEHIKCMYEDKILPHDEFGKKVLQKMMTDKDFSKACHIHQQFVKAEFDNMVSEKKRLKAFEELRERFELSSSMRPADPVELFRLGIWKDKEVKGESKSKTKKIRTKDIDLNENFMMRFDEIDSITKGEQNTNNNKDMNTFDSNGQEYTNDVRPIEYNFEKKNPTKGETLYELERLEKIYVEKENYEKAAEILEKIKILKSKM